MNYDDNVYYEENYNYLETEYYDSFDDFNYKNDFQETFENCIKPSISQIAEKLAPIYLYLVIYQIIISRGILKIRILNIFNIIGCMFILKQTFTPSLLSTLIIHFLIVYLLIKCVKRYLRGYNGIFTTCISLIYILSCEFFLIKQDKWNQIRGAQMILMMKLISFSFDIDNFKIREYDIISFMDYLLSINTSIFGPWISYDDYLNHFEFKNRTILDFKNMIKTIFYSILSLCLSNCCMNFFSFYMNTSNNLLDAYTNAFSFRFSNYFILFTSNSLCLLNNIKHGFNKKDFVYPFEVELPRSLINVVTNWNLPMHFWLKTYVFRQIKKYGNFKALILTYAVSSLLHGLNLKIASVLLSLAIYTYVEYVFRKKLSKKLNACVDSKKCIHDCTHSHKSFSALSMFINFSFLLINMFHLAYLGQMFDANTGDDVNSLNYTITKWSQLYYSSHLIVLGFYIVYIFI